VNWDTADGTARAATDYRSEFGTVRFAPGETTKSVSVTVVGETEKETDETFLRPALRPRRDRHHPRDRHRHDHRRRLRAG